MGNRNRTRPKGRIKDSYQTRAYHQFLAQSPYQPEETVDVYNPNLSGSDSLYELLDDEEIQKPIPKPAKIKFRDFIKSNAYEIVFLVILIPVLTWVVLSVFALKTETSNIAIRIENLKESINTINSDYVAKDILTVQIDNIKKDFNYSILLNYNDIENRLNLVEQQIQTVLTNIN